MNLRRWLTAGLCGACLLLTIVNPPARTAAAATTPNAVRWSLDEHNKQIIVSVKLQFWNEYNCASTPSGVKCSTSPSAPSAAMVQRFVDAILRYWGGHKFKCWDVVVKVDASAIADSQAADADSVDIGLVETPVHVTPYVLSGANGDHYLSTDPKDRAVAMREAGEVSAEWPTRATTPDYVYAHEFGHIVGLDDNYSDAKDHEGELLPGATSDLMYGQNDGSRHVSEDMITRMVLRSGLDVSKIKCPMTSDGGPTNLNLFLASIDDFKLHIYTCDYDPPTSDPKRKPAPINWKGTVHLGGSYLTQISIPGFPSGSGTTDFPVAFSGTIPAAGGNITIPMDKDLSIVIPVQWGADGILHSTEAALIAAGGETLSTSYFFPGPPIMATFVSKAPECPK